MLLVLAGLVFGMILAVVGALMLTKGKRVIFRVLFVILALVLVWLLFFAVFFLWWMSGVPRLY